MFLSFFNKTQKITVVNTGVVIGEDDFGNDIYSDTSTIEYDCLVASGAQNASIDGMNLLQSFDMKVYLPVDAYVKASSKIIYNGAEYMLDGIPDRKNSLFSNEFVEPKLILKLIRKSYV